jgi:hypothetical protein
MSDGLKNFFGVLIAICVVIGLLVLLMWGYQSFRVYSAGQAGKAELAQAEYNRQIIVRQAQAKLDASTLEAEAAVAHAKGVKESNDIISNSLGGPEGYLRFLYIQMLQDSDNKQVIYIPTEAGLPILEARNK